MRCTLFSVLMTSVIVHAHMEISWPPAFRSKFNPQSAPGTVDYSMTNPLSKDGSNYPCKGYHTDMKGSSTTGATKWNAGSKYNYTVVGGADHNGGSCQASLSYDNGNTFKVIHSYIGSCPLPNTGNFEFTVPSDAKPGNAIFAWTWLNKVGNREFYMNCAAVNIAPSTGEGAAPPKIPFSSRPDIFLANLGNGCESIEGKDAVYPDPGPDVTGMTMGVESSSTLKGQCSQVKPIIPSQKLSPHPLPNSTNSSGQIPFATSATAPSTTSTARPNTSGTPSYGMKISSNGECGDQQTCSGSIYGHCCSKFGYCGDTSAHCGTGCSDAFGECGMNVTSKHIRIRGTLFH